MGDTKIDYDEKFGMNTFKRDLQCDGREVLGRSNRELKLAGH